MYSKFLFSLGFLALFIAGCKKELNQVPKAEAGSSKVITLPTNSSILSGSGSDDDGYIVSYLWSQVAGPSPATIVNPGSANTAVNGCTQGNYVFQLMVTDDKGATGVDTVSLLVNPSLVQTLSLQPSNNPNEKMLIQVGNQDNSNSGSNEWAIDAWTIGGQQFIGRSIFKFDLTSIPVNATILSASLYLYSNTPPEAGNFIDANFGSDNGLILQRITSNWVASTTNWSNQPQTSVSDQILIPATSSSVLDLNLNVKTLVSAMVNNSSNFGFMLRLQNETPYRSRAFVSSYNALKSQLHPKLVITYQ